MRLFSTLWRFPWEAIGCKGLLWLLRIDHSKGFERKCLKADPLHNMPWNSGTRMAIQQSPQDTYCDNERRSSSGHIDKSWKADAHVREGRRTLRHAMAAQNSMTLSLLRMGAVLL